MINKDSLTHHISQQFSAELEDVRSHLLAMGGLGWKKQVNDAVSALIDADSGLAQQVPRDRRPDNQMERNIDEECVHILARASAGGLRPAPDHQHLEVGDRPPSGSATRILQGRSAAPSSCAREGGRRAATSRFGIGSRVQRDGAGGTGRLRPLRCRPGAVRGAVRQDRRSRIQDRTARAGHLHDGRPAGDIPRALNIIWALRSPERIGDHARNFIASSW